MKKQLTVWMVCLMLLGVFLPAPVQADMGPKPSVCITFENMEDEPCYGTLISEQKSTGPASAWDGGSEWKNPFGLDPQIWQAFQDYVDPDGFYFLQEAWLCSEDRQLNWTYYPPDTFKILLYYPESGHYAVSGVYERYAFDSYFTVDLAELNFSEESAAFSAEKSYEYTAEILSLLFRVVLTVAVEILIALCFGFRSKKQLRVILLVNLVTQIFLNLALNAVGFYRGPWAAVFWYVVMEIVVFLLEAAVYTAVFHKGPKDAVSVSRCVGYAFSANLISLILGRWISIWVPQMF